ncbi:hypothetical protein CUMW_134800 [Citrus unshiu]|nr:hypothetical protein CUMW_134800 [Citrus unshiu]
MLPPLIGNFSSPLQKFAAYNCKIKGSIPQEIGNLRGLILAGHIPHCLAILISLRELNLGSNKLRASILSPLLDLLYILKINFSSDLLSGSFPHNIQNLKVLVDLDLSRNQLSGDMPKTFVAQRFSDFIITSVISLESFDLSSNNIFGQIPKSLEAL